MSLERRYAIVLTLALGACMAKAKEVVPEAPPETDWTEPRPSDPTPPVRPAPGGPLVESTRARVRFKDGERYKAALASALDLAPTSVCVELGRYDCVSQVHTIALGGVDAYESGIFEPLETGLSTSLAVERVALSACAERARLDLSSPSGALIFRKDAGSVSIEDATDRLYRRFFARAPLAEERTALAGMMESLRELGEADVDRSWSTLSCFAVATSVESLFY